MAESQENKIHILQNKLNIVSLDPYQTFQQFTEKEKKYAYHMYKASWAGYMIVSKQISHESSKLIELFIDIFSTDYAKQLLSFIQSNEYIFSHVNLFLNYVATVLSNAGNYLSYGDTKFIPNMTKEDMRSIFTSHFPTFIPRYIELEDIIFSLNENEKK